MELKAESRAGYIGNLQRQVDFCLEVNSMAIGWYRADFVYERNSVRVIEDAKGILTPMCRWKLKHMAAQGDVVTLWPPRPKKERKRKCK